jgi:gas vesicle protein
MTWLSPSALRQKYEEFQEEKASLQKRIKDIDVGTLEAAIKLIDPKVELANAVAASARSALQGMFMRGELGKELRGKLRDTEKPLSAAQISDAILAVKDHSASKDVRQKLRQTVSAQLNYLYRTNAIERVKQDSGIVWKIAHRADGALVSSSRSKSGGNGAS